MFDEDDDDFDVADNHFFDSVAPIGSEQNRICTDFKIYESIFFHIMQNAIKYSTLYSTIKVKCSFES